MAQLDLQSTSALLWLALCLAVAYRPVQRLWLRVLSMRHRTSSYGALHAALTQLTTTLDTATLLATIQASVRETFDLPAFALYNAPSDHAHALVLVAQERLADAPARIENGAVLQLLSQQRGVRANAWMEQQLRYQPLHADEAQMLHYPQVVLWCPIVHHDGQLLALLLLGMRGDVDPYRAQDRRELQRLLDAAALALTNSAAYRRQIEAEAVIRHLYQQVQVAQHTTATAIARELHDEVININVRLNIESVYKVLSLVETPAARAELELMLQSEYTVVDTLRRICEDLNPTGSDDPLGLDSVVRAQIERLCAPWAGTWSLTVAGTPVPLAGWVQREVVRIVREALTNSIKHADATHITVLLQYASASGNWVELAVQDDGRTPQSVMPKPQHWGLHYMAESARTIGGALTIGRARGGGTLVQVRFPVQE